MTRLAMMFLETTSGSVNWLTMDGMLISSSGRILELSNVRKYKSTRNTSITTNCGESEDKLNNEVALDTWAMRFGL